jgi:uncharacterized protein
VIAYPGGDISLTRGVCTDVIVRALRTARDLDLQSAIHTDLMAHRAAYPQRWGRSASATDRNIVHRRVPNQMTYFARRGYAQPLAAGTTHFLAGDIVAWDLGRGVLHIGVVSDRTHRTGRPMIIHNIGRGVREDDILSAYRVIGHYRLPPVRR